MAKVSGSNIFIIILAILFIGAVTTAVIYMASGNQETSDNVAPSNSAASSDNQEPQKDTAKYLTISELGLRIKLTDNIQDAYYVVGEAPTRGAEAPVHLSTRSLDAFAECAATETNRGVAVLNNYNVGESGGTSGTTRPDTQTINGLRFDITGGQNDCTKGQNTELYTKVKQELVNSSKTIEPTPAIP